MKNKFKKHFKYEDKEEKNEEETKAKIYYYTKNHLNSIVAITDNKGKVIEKYTYDVFGKPYISEGKSNKFKEFKESKIGNTRLYTGREYDREINLYYLRARYYNPILGRFISKDPVDISDDVNLYGYVGNNGVMFVDPSGTVKKWIKENEGNAWYFESQNYFKTGHAALYFIDNGNEYLINYNPTESLGFNPFNDGDMFFGTVRGTNQGTLGTVDYKNMIVNGIVGGYSITKINEKYINTYKLSKWYNEKYSNLPLYNTFTNNCSDEVEKALEYSGFFQYTNGFVLGSIPIPGTTPGGLGYDINLELKYRMISEKINNLLQ